MKKSKYNFIRQIGTQDVLYNAMTESISILDPKVARLYQENSVEEIQESHPGFYKHLCDNGFLINDETNELQTLLEQWHSEDNDPGYFSLSVNPTLNCNMDCWYCYEKHDGDLNMKESIMENIKKFISIKISDEQLNRFHLGFFGGEPLLNFNRVAKQLIDFATEQAISYNKVLTLSFVTNGYLLSNEILNYLHNLGHLTTFQITLDGNEDIHNHVRHTKTGGQSYEPILRNASHILKYSNMTLVLRCNFTAASLRSFIDVATDLSTWTDNPDIDISHLTIDLHQVWQDLSNNKFTDINVTEEEVREAFQLLSLPISIKRKAKRYRCYADRNNNALVNYNGDLFRCTARDFSPKRKEGVIDNMGHLVWNERSESRNAVKWANTTCQTCEIYPLCCGSCSQIKIESSCLFGCDYGYNQKDKHEIITERVTWLLNKAQYHNTNH